MPQKYTLSNTYGFSALKFYCIGRSVRLRETMKAKYMTRAKIIYRKSAQIRAIRGDSLAGEAIMPEFFCWFCFDIRKILIFAAK